MPDTYVGCTCHRRHDQLGSSIGNEPASEVDAGFLYCVKLGW